MVYPAETFDPEATLRACAQERCTSLYGVPTMFIAELGHRAFAESRPRLAADGDHGRLAVPDRGDEAVNSEMGIEQISIAFGMTETSPVTTQVRVDDTLEHRCGTVGQVMPHTEIKIVDPGHRADSSRAASPASSARAAIR